MKELFKALGLFLMLVVILTFFGYGLNYLFNPAYRALESKTFKQSDQYNDGMIRDFENLKLEYLKASNESVKKVIALTIKHRFSVYLEKLSHEQRTFYNSL